MRVSIGTRTKTIARHAIRAALIRGWFRAHRIDWGANGGEMPVLMCLWNRPERIGPVLELLDAQTHPGGIHLYLWNNQRADHERYRDAVDAFRPAGALRGVSLVKSPHNIGSIARFYWARKLELAAPDRPVIVLDDDEDITPTFVSEATAQYDPAAVSAWWAWHIDSAYYWDRHLAEPGERVDHVGPGGSIMSSSVVADPRFFTGIPEEFRMLDDIWLSHYAVARGLELRKLETDITFVLDETNQFHGQGDLKARFYDHLRAGG